MGKATFGGCGRFRWLLCGLGEVKNPALLRSGWSSDMSPQGAAAEGRKVAAG